MLGSQYEDLGAELRAQLKALRAEERAKRLAGRKAVKTAATAAQSELLPVQGAPLSETSIALKRRAQTDPAFTQTTQAMADPYTPEGFMARLDAAMGHAPTRGATLDPKRAKVRAQVMEAVAEADRRGKLTPELAQKLAGQVHQDLQLPDDRFLNQYMTPESRRSMTGAVEDVHPGRIVGHALQGLSEAVAQGYGVTDEQLKQFHESQAGKVAEEVFAFANPPQLMVADTAAAHGAPAALGETALFVAVPFIAKGIGKGFGMLMERIRGDRFGKLTEVEAKALNEALDGVELQHGAKVAEEARSAWESPDLDATFRKAKETPVEPAPLDDTPPVAETPQTGAQVPKTLAQEAPTGAAKARDELSSMWEEFQGKWESGHYLPKDVGAGFGAFQPSAELIADLSKMAVKAIELGVKSAPEFIARFPKELRAHAQKAWDEAHASKAEAPRATGLANQVQTRESLAGVIPEIASGKGSTAQMWQKVGKNVLEADPSFDVDGLAARIAYHEVPATGENIGILLEGKVRKMAAIKTLQAKIDSGGLDGPSLAKARKELDDAEENLQNFLEDVQVGKGIWHDVGQALQAGTDLDTGSFADVIVAARRKGTVTAGDEKAYRQLTDEISRNQRRIAELEAEIPKQAEVAIAKARSSARRFDKAAGQAQIAAGFERLKNIELPMPPSMLGSGPILTSEHVRFSKEVALAVKDIAIGYAKIGAANLEDVVLAVQKGFRENGREIERQAVIDALAHTEGRPLSEQAKELNKLRIAARKDSTLRFLEDQAKSAKQDFLIEQRANVRTAKRQMDYNERTDLRDAIDEIKKAKKAEWKTVQEAQAAWQKGENIVNAAEKSAYRQWWHAQARVLDAKLALEEGRALVKGTKTTTRAADTEALLKEARELEAQINAKASLAESEGKLRTGIDVARPKSSVSDEVKALRERKAEVEAMISANKTRAELEGQLRTGIRVEKRVQKPVSEELSDLRSQNKVLAARVKSRLHEQTDAPWVRGLERGTRTISSLRLGADLGVLTRQALFTLTRPKAYIKALGEALPTTFSEKNMVKLQEHWDAERMGDRLVSRSAKEAGLSTTDLLGGHEEMVALEWLRKVPGINKASGSLGRFQQAFINSARREVFKQGMKAGFTKSELASRARFINAATGRGNIKNVPALARIIMTSPRYEASRWEMLFEPIRNVANLGTGAVKNRRLDRAAVANLRDMATTAGAVWGVFKLAERAGYEVDFDPTSSDFLKMRRGNEVWDVTAGVSQRLRDVMRLYASFKATDPKHAMGRVLSDAGVRTLSPGIRTPIAQLSQFAKGQTGEDVTDPVSGYPADDSEQGWIAVAPLVWQAFAQAEDDYVGSGPGVGLKEFLGGGVNFYPKKENDWPK